MRLPYRSIICGMNAGLVGLPVASPAIRRLAWDCIPITGDDPK